MISAVRFTLAGRGEIASGVDLWSSGVGDRDVGDGRGETRLLEVAGVWGLGAGCGRCGGKLGLTLV